MKSLYRRYRPLKLEDVVGQEQVTVPLIQSLKAGKVSHAYLFIGPRGCGKTSVARIMAHEINGFEYKIEDDYVDIIEIDGASNRGIDNIRELREKVAIAPSIGKYKVYIIDEVHMLTKEAFNALLKTLEEPPAHAVFIMATTDAYKVPVTITSRAQVYTFKLAEAKLMFDYLKTIADKEKIKISDDALELIVRQGGGSFRDTLSLLDQISTLSDSEITSEMVVKAMGLPEDEKIGELLDAYLSGDISVIASKLQELLSSGIKPETLNDEIIARIIREPGPQLLPLLGELAEIKAPHEEARLLVALSARILHKQTPPQSFTDGQSERILSGDGSFAPVAQGAAHHSTSVVTSGTPRKDSSRLSSGSSSEFDWNIFTSKVQELNDAVYSQLMKCEYEFSNGELRLYPKRKIVQTILSRDNNKSVLLQAVDGVKITIVDASLSPSSTKPDETLSKISAIMGGEVRNDGGTSPF